METFQDQHREELQLIAQFFVQQKNESEQSSITQNIDLDQAISQIQSLESKIVQLVEVGRKQLIIFLQVFLLDKQENLMELLDNLTAKVDDMEIQFQSDLEEQRMQTRSWQQQHDLQLEKTIDQSDQLQALEDKVNFLIQRNQQLESLSRQYEEFRNQTNSDENFQLLQQFQKEQLEYQDKIQTLNQLLAAKRAEIRQLEMQLCKQEIHIKTLEDDIDAKNDVLNDLKRRKIIYSRRSTRTNLIVGDISQLRRQSQANQMRFRLAQDSEDESSRYQETLADLLGGDVCELRNTTKMSKSSAPNYKIFGTRFNLKLEELKSNENSPLRFDNDYRQTISEKSQEGLITQRNEKKKPFIFPANDSSFIQDPYYEHFLLVDSLIILKLSQSAKLNSNRFSSVLMKDTTHLYHELVEKKVPFNKWYSRLLAYLEERTLETKPNTLFSEQA